MYANPCLQTEGFVKTSPTRIQNKKFVSVQINTDPWLPECQKCLERENFPPTVANNLINVNEYTKAINYINSIHNLINGSLLKQVQTKDGTSNLLGNCSMPDLPNFLALLSHSNVHQNYNEKSSQMVSRTTSTSTLINIGPIYDNESQNIATNNIKVKINTSDTQLQECGFGNRNKPNKQEILQAISTENCAPQNHFMQDSVSESSTESDTSDSNEITEYYILENTKVAPENISKLHQKSGSKPGNCSKTYKIINLANSQHKIIYQNEKSMNQQQRHTDRNTNHRQKATGIGDRYRTSPLKSLNRQRNPPKKKNDWKIYIPRNFEENEGKPKERTLSDAELDRYASELLYGSMNLECYTSNTKTSMDCQSPSSIPKLLAGEQLKTKSQTAPTRSSTAVLKKNLIQNIKEVATKCIEKQTGHNPIRQKRSPPSSHKSKNPNSREKNSETYKQGYSNSSTTVTNSDNRIIGHSRKSSPAATRSTIECRPNNKKEGKTMGAKRVLKSHTPIINLQKPRTPTTASKHNRGQNCDECVIGEHASSMLILPDQKLIILPQVNQSKQRPSTTLKKSPTWVVHQKDYDDFVCQVKKTPSKSSESAILTDKDEPGQIMCVDSDINDDSAETKDLECTKQHHVYTNSTKGSPSNPQHQSHELTPKERVLPTFIPVKTDVRNKPFRQARRECMDREETVDIRNCISQQKKKIAYSDSASNVSRSSISSDIKSDRDNSPLRVGERHSIIKNRYTNCATGKLRH